VSRYQSRHLANRFEIVPKFNHLFSGPLPTFTEDFMQIRSEVFAQEVVKRQTDKQTDKQRRKHNLLGGGNKIFATAAKAGRGKKQT